MNRHDALERELTAWFVDTALPRTPDYTNDIVQMTATVRQRPRWMVPERWLPMTVVPLVRRSTRPAPWRTVGVLALFVVLIAAAAILVGSQPRLPSPFGLAANGLVAYPLHGDIVTVDPATGTRRWITSGNEEDRDPRWSLDGTRLAFLRNNVVASASDLGDRVDVVVVVDQDGHVIAKSRPIPGIDPDAVAWSPDGRTVAVGARGRIQLVDAADGSISASGVRYLNLDFYWRPGDGREILFQGRTSEGEGLVVANVDDPAGARLIASQARGEFLRPNGWTADGQRVVYTRMGEASGSASLQVLDVATRAETRIEAGFAHVSNDGKRVLAIDPSGQPCVASIDGGPCIAIADTTQAYEGSHAAAAHWAPNDEWVVVRLYGPDGVRGLLLDPTGGTNEQPEWLTADAESWQRVAP